MKIFRIYKRCIFFLHFFKPSKSFIQSVLRFTNILILFISVSFNLFSFKIVFVDVIIFFINIMIRENRGMLSAPKDKPSPQLAKVDGQRQYRVLSRSNCLFHLKCRESKMLWCVVDTNISMASKT